MQQTQQEKQQKIIIANTPVYQQLPMDRWMAYEKSFNKHKYKSNINNNNNNKNTTTTNIININNIIKLINTFSVYNNNNKNHQHEQHNTFLIVLQTPQQRSQSQQHPRKITLTIINLYVNSLEYSLNSQQQQQPYNILQYLHCGQKQHQATTPQLSHNHNHHQCRSIEKTLLLPNNTITKSYNVLSTSPLSYNIKSIATLGLKSLSVTSFMAISIIVNKKNTIKNYEDFTKNLESILIQLFIELFLIYYNYLYLNLHRHRKSFRRKSSSYSFSKFPSLYHHCKSLVA